MTYRVLAAAWGWIGLVVISVGCGTQSSQKVQKLKSCTYDFTADVRSGANAGVRLLGKLVFGQSSEGNLLGRLTPTGKTDYVMMTGQIAADKITLQFWFKDGVVVRGTGPYKSSGAGKCPEQLDGDLITSVPTDKGDWLARSLSLDQGDICASGCTLVPTDQDQCVMTCQQLSKGISGNILSNFPSNRDGMTCEQFCAGSIGTFDCSEGNTFGGTCNTGN